jgi:hypothetical protein
MEGLIMRDYYIHQSARYNAQLHPRAGLIVCSTRKPGGIVMQPDHPQFAAYVDAIKTAIDTSEADALCKALIK